MIQEEATQAWQLEFAKLPPERQLAVQRWFAVQAYTAQQLGLTVEAWMEYVQWAFAHPLDYSFLADYPEVASGLTSGDGFEAGASHQATAALLGQKPTVVSTEQPQTGTSLFAMMLGRPEKKDESGESNNPKR